jgi:hypothetical protein
MLVKVVLMFHFRGLFGVKLLEKGVLGVCTLDSWLGKCIVGKSFVRLYVDKGCGKVRVNSFSKR